MRGVQDDEGSALPGRSKERKVALLPKNIYRLLRLMRLFKNAINRYLGFISAFDDVCNGVKKLNKLIGDVKANDRTYKGFTLFEEGGERILLAAGDGKYNLKAYRIKRYAKKCLRRRRGKYRVRLRRLRVHRLIKKIGRTYLYYHTEFGKSENRLSWPA
jgi:hypothetical protein